MNTPPKKVILAVDEDDHKFVINTSDEIQKAMEENPNYTDEFMDVLYERWIPARDLDGDPVWLNTNRLKRLEFKDVKVVKVM